MVEDFQCDTGNRIQVTRDMVLKLECLRLKERRPGVCKTRFEHIYSLLGVNMSEPCIDAVRFGNLYARIIEMIIDGSMSADVYEYLRDIELFDLDKGIDDIRPLGFNCVHRKIASAIVLKAVSYTHLTLPTTPYV